MKTLKKAKEIYNNQINRLNSDSNFSLTQRKVLLNKVHLTRRLYKIYLYTKIVQQGLKKLQIIYLFKRNKFKNLIFKGLSSINKIPKQLQLQKIDLLIQKLVRKFYLPLTKSSLKTFKLKNQLKELLLNLRFLIFSNFFEYKISSDLKLRKKFIVLKNELNKVLFYLKELKLLSKGKAKLQNLIFKLRKFFKQKFISARWSNRFLLKLFKKIQLVVFVYLAMGFILLLELFSCLCSYDHLTLKFAKLFNVTEDILLIKLQNIIGNYSSKISILYLALFLKPKNILMFPKKAISHIGFCAVLSLFIAGLDFSKMIINYVVKSLILFIDIYFCRFFIRTKKKLTFLRNFTDLLTTQESLENYYTSKLFNIGSLFSVEKMETITWFDYPVILGRYEYMIEKILYVTGITGIVNVKGSGKFINSYIYLPFYVILLLGLIYNCCYYVIYNKQPYIPIVTNLVKKLTPNNQND